MKLKLLATFFLISSYLSSQQTVTTSGGNIESDQVSLSYTIGQLKVNTIEKVDSSIQELTVEIEKLKKELELLKQSK